ncbi:MAG TPA: filamentous hemagglutinin N-terminal domain-containing protein, partial [Oceanipulchritudo sp.]|nr:filamentous hemagglutinin N-terminal domain-containing protein [Oceanipulchritudo sp.]
MKIQSSQLPDQVHTPSLPSIPGMALVATALLYGLSAATAGVVNPEVVAGTADFSTVGATTTITTSNVAIINYSQFGVAANETLQFVQPAVDSRVLNRVMAGANPSEILGNLYANGRVFIVNPAGIIFGANSVVDAGQIYAAAGSISDTDFLDGQLRFDNLQGGVLNEGQISASTVALIGKHIANSGLIDSPDGTIAIVAGDSVYLGSIDGGIYVQITNATDIVGAAIENSGTLNAEDGAVILEAGDFYSLAIKQSGVIRGGDIDLTGGDGGFADIRGDIVYGVDQPGSLDLRADGFVFDPKSISGKAGGSVLLDPTILNIVADGEVLDTNPAPPPAGGDDGYVKASLIESLLEADSSVTLEATDTINVNEPIAPANPSTVAVTLNFNEQVSGGDG